MHTERTVKRRASDVAMTLGATLYNRMHFLTKSRKLQPRGSAVGNRLEPCIISISAATAHALAV